MLEIQEVHYLSNGSVRVKIGYDKITFECHFHNGKEFRSMYDVLKYRQQRVAEMEQQLQELNTVDNRLLRFGTNTLRQQVDQEKQSLIRSLEHQKSTVQR